MELILKIIFTSVIALFYLFFFIRNILLSWKLGTSVKNKDPLVNLSILSSFLATSYTLTMSWIDKEELFLYRFSFYAHPGLRITSVALVAGGIILSIISSLSLQDSWRVGVHKEARTALITHGIYSRIRNPYFLSSGLVMLAYFLFIPTLIALVLGLLTVTTFHLLALKEEKYLLQIHGDTYTDYIRRVRRYGLF